MATSTSKPAKVDERFMARFLSRLPEPGGFADVAAHITNGDNQERTLQRPAARDPKNGFGGGNRGSARILGYRDGPGYAVGASLSSSAVILSQSPGFVPTATYPSGRTTHIPPLWNGSRI